MKEETMIELKAEIRDALKELPKEIARWWGQYVEKVGEKAALAQYEIWKFEEKARLQRWIADRSAGRG